MAYKLLLSILGLAIHWLYELFLCHVISEFSRSSHRNKFMLIYHSHTLPRGAAWLWEPIVGLQCELSPLVTSPSNGKELPKCALDWIVNTSWHARWKKKPYTFYRDDGLAPQQTCIVGKGRIDILVIQPTVPTWHDFKQALRDLSNPFRLASIASGVFLRWSFSDQPS